MTDAIAPEVKGKTIDIGCGATLIRCCPGFDVYTDIVEPDLGLPGKYVRCAMESMPFADKEFEYARCYHAIEHCEDPDAACSEILRIASSGTISFPPAQAELMFGRREHRWFVFIDFPNDPKLCRLLFVRKRNPSYNIKSHVSGCQKSVNFHWEGSFDWRVIQ